MQNNSCTFRFRIKNYWPALKLSFRTIHDAIRDPDELSVSVVERLGHATAFLRIFTICRIIYECKSYDSSSIPKPSATVTPILEDDIEVKIRKYGIDKNQWLKLRLRSAKFSILLCRE